MFRCTMFKENSSDINTSRSQCVFPHAESTVCLIYYRSNVQYYLTRIRKLSFPTANIRDAKSSSRDSLILFLSLARSLVPSLCPALLREGTAYQINYFQLDAPIESRPNNLEYYQRLQLAAHTQDKLYCARRRDFLRDLVVNNVEYRADVEEEER